MKCLSTLAVTFALATACAANGAETLSYVFVNDQIGNPASRTVERSDDGLFTVKFIYKHNGRGPELTERFRLAADSSFSDSHVTGTSTFGAVVDERFERKGDWAQWRSTSEHGRARASPAMYLPLNSAYAPYTVFIAALAQRPDLAMPLLPKGTLRMRKLDEVEVERDGKRQRVQLVAQTGTGLQPTLLWATTGPAPRCSPSPTWPAKSSPRPAGRATASCSRIASGSPRTGPCATGPSGCTIPCRD